VALERHDTPPPWRITHHPNRTDCSELFRL
jgi:hypothetical protein